MEMIVVGALGVFALSVVIRRVVRSLKPAFEPPRGASGGSYGEGSGCGSGGCGDCGGRFPNS